MTHELTDEEIEALAIKHEAFGFGRVDERGLTTHGFDPDGLRDFARALLAHLAQRGTSEPVAWIYEDTLPKEYPYDAMFPLSEVRGGVRMFPVYGAPQAVQPMPDGGKGPDHG